jgi:3-(3-hydroxy-phenyl)propionate hydroxylase
MIRLAKWMGKLVMPRNQYVAFLFHGITRLAALTPGLRKLLVDIKIKPKNRFRRGLFVARKMGNRFEHGNHLVQGRLRNAAGEILLSDDVLGHQLQLIGIGIDPVAQLSQLQLETWRSLGGKTTIIGNMGSSAESVWSDLENAFGVDRFQRGWIVAVRPDKVVIADGAPEQADAIVQRVVGLLIR